MDIFLISYYYNEGLKEIKSSFGKNIYFNRIIDSKNNQSICEKIDQLSFSIPYYIFYGGSDQIEKFDTHLKNLNESLDNCRAFIC